MNWSWDNQSWKIFLNVYKTFSPEPFEGAIKTFWRQLFLKVLTHLVNIIGSLNLKSTWRHFKDGSFLILKTTSERVQTFQHEQFECVMGAIWRLSFQMVSRHLVIVFISYDLKLRCRHSEDGTFFHLKYAFWTSSKHFSVSNLKALRIPIKDSISKDLKCTLLTSSNLITWSWDEDVRKTGVFLP